MKKTGLLLTAVSLLCCCQPASRPDDGETDGGNPEVKPVPVLPEVPEKAQASNTFLVDFFSCLREEEAVPHIRNASGQKPVLYLFGQVDFVPGQASPVVKVAYQTRCQPFLVLSGRRPQGIGMVSRYQTAEMDGVRGENGFSLSGCRIPLPLSTVSAAYLYTAELENADDAVQLLAAGRLQENGMVIGTAVPEAVSRLRKSMGEKKLRVRLTVLEEPVNGKQLFVLVPGNYVCREIASLPGAREPAWRVTLEQIVWE